MLNPFEGMFFEKGTKRQGMEDLFGGGGFFSGPSSAAYLGSSVGSYDGENDGYLGFHSGNSNNANNNGNGSTRIAKLRRATMPRTETEIATRPNRGHRQWPEFSLQNPNISETR